MCARVCVRFICCLLLCWWYAAAHAQEKVMTIACNLGAKAQALPIKDKTSGNYTLVANDRGKLYVWRMGDNFALANIYEIPLNPEHRNGNLIGGMQKEGTLWAYLVKANRDLTMLTLNVDSGDYKVRTLSFMEPTDHVLKTFTLGSTFWLLAVSETQKGLVAYRSTDGGAFTRAVLNIGGLGAKPAEFSLFHYLADRYKDLAEVPEIVDEAENPPSLTWHPFKIYPKEDKITLTLDGDGATRIVTIGTADLALQTETVRYPKVETDAAWKKGNGNSLIVHGLLYQVVAGMQELHLRVFDAGNLELIKNLSAKSGRDIDFRNGPIFDYERIKDGGSQAPRLLKTSAEFYKRLAEQQIALSVDDGFERTHLVTVAAVKSTLKGPGVKAGSLPTDNVDPEGGVVRENKSSFEPYAYQQPAYRSFALRAPRQTTLFKTLLDAGTLDNLREEVPNSALEKVSNFERSMTGLRAQTFINTGWGYVLGYYNPATGAYVLVSFTEGE
jgi:hypothetical protein